METVELTGKIKGPNQIQIDQTTSIQAETPVRITLHYELNETELEKQMRVARQVMAEDKNLLGRLAE